MSISREDLPFETSPQVSAVSPLAIEAGTDPAVAQHMVVGTIRILPPRNRRADVLGILLSVQGPIRAKPGCSACDIYEERGPERAILFVERWISDAALEMHVRSEVYLRLLTAMELCAGPPDIRFEHVSSTEGMELIERLRR